MKYNDENMNKLAHQTVQGWDMNTLMQYTVDKVEENYKCNKYDFIEDLKFYPDLV